MITGKTVFKIFCWVAFIIYLVVLARLIFFETKIDNVTYRYLQISRGISIKINFKISNWVPGISTWAIINSNQGLPFILQNLVGNIVGFIPMGLLIAILFVRARSYKMMAIIGCATSAFIETTQLLAVRGYFDVDDIILNTTGVVTGYFLFCTLVVPLVQRLKISALLQ